MSAMFIGGCREHADLSPDAIASGGKRRANVTVRALIHKLIAHPPRVAFLRFNTYDDGEGPGPDGISRTVKVSDKAQIAELLATLKDSTHAFPGGEEPVGLLSDDSLSISFNDPGESITVHAGSIETYWGVPMKRLMLKHLPPDIMLNSESRLVQKPK
jgi:hypothetical protein